MEFTLVEERRLLQDTVRRFLSKEYAFEKRRANLASREGWSREAWRGLADLGVLGLTIPEAEGGMGGDAFDTAIVMEALGRALVVEPYVATVVLGAGIVAEAGSKAQRSEWLPAVASGEKMLALAHTEPAARYATRQVETRATRESRGWRIDGFKSVALGAPMADAMLVTARSAGEPDDEGGVSLFLVPRDASGVTLRPYATHDGARAADVRLENVVVADDRRVGAADAAMAVVERALDRGAAALCAEAVGIIEALNEATLEYLKTRKQFGQPIGRFQALQHRMAEMTIKAVEARSMAIVAAAAMRNADATQRARQVSAAKALIGQAARFVGQQAIQLHGAIGVTDELVVSHWFKRLTVIDGMFGDADFHLARFSDLILAEA